MQNSNGPINLARPTYPPVGLDVSTVGLHIEGQAGSTSATVPLVASAPANPPPPQYEVTGITISPVTVVISGDPATLGKIQRITLPAIDLSAATSTVKVSVSIPYPDNVSGNPATATITFTIQRNPSVTPSP
jgi:YbbR domain-containing protein